MRLFAQIDKPMIAGIDGIHLTSKDYAIKDINALKKAGWKQSASGNIGDSADILIRDNSGKEIRANKVYNNEQKICKYDVSPYGVLMHFNPSKAYHAYNLISTGKELNALTASIQKEVAQIGIDIDINAMRLSRLDLSKQSVMKHDVSSYASAFRLLQAKRSAKKEYPSGYYFHNKKRETIFYDKALESDLEEENFMRCETKWKDTKTVISATKIISLNQLTETSNEDLNNVYRKHLTDNVFCRKNIGLQSVLDFSNEAEILKVFVATNKRSAWKDYLLLMDIDISLTAIGGIEKFIDLCEVAGYSRAQRFRIKSELKNMINKKAFMDGRRKKISPSELLEEVYQKFA